jgi:hypothetical protein
MKKNISSVFNNKFWIILIFIICLFFALFFTLSEYCEHKTKKGIRVHLEKHKDLSEKIFNINEEISQFKSIKNKSLYDSRMIIILERMTAERISINELAEIINIISETCNELKDLCGFSVPVALSLLFQESRGDPRALSETSDRGLWQLHNTTGKRIFNILGYGTRNYLKHSLNPLKNTVAAMYHIRYELYPYWRERIEDKNLILMSMIHSYRWGSPATERLRKSWARDRMPGLAYTYTILERSIEIEKQLIGD